MRFVTVFTLLCYYARAHDDAYSLQYTTDNFADEVAKTNHFVMFYAPWCGHCQRLAPAWEQLAEMLNEEDGNVKIAKVDCTTDKQVCSEQDVTGYPTLKFFKKGQLEGEKFRGTRDLPTLTNFINEQLRQNEEAEIDRTESSLVELTEETFDDHVKEGSHFVKLYAPWCGHCQQLAPVWEQLAKAFENDPTVSVSKLDCTKYRSVCTRYNIPGYPTLLWIRNGEKVEKYQGSRTLEDLVPYVENMKNRAVSQGDDSTEKSTTFKSVELTAVDFPDYVKNGVVLIKFFAPWCGHCKSLAPTWDNLGLKYKDHHKVKIGKVDCSTDVDNKDLCADQKVEGFPTIYLYKNGEKISEYLGGRTIEDLTDFVESHATHEEL